MGRKSSIHRLDPRIREAVDAAIRENRATVDEIAVLIHAMGGDASRSAVGRYKHSAELQMQRYREAQQVAAVWLKRFDDDPDSDVARLLPEMLRSVAFQQLADADEDTKASELSLLARAVRDAASAAKMSTDQVLRVRKEMGSTLARKVGEAEAKPGGPGPMTAERLKDIIREAYGV